MKKIQLKTLNFGRLRLLLAVAIILSAILLVWNLFEFATTDTAGAPHPRNRILGAGVLHLLTVAAAWVVWYSLRERKRDQERLVASEQKHRTILNHAGEAIFLLDREGRVREWNKAAERLFGAARRTVLGQPLCEIHHCHGLELGQAMADAERLDRGLSFEFPQQRPAHPDGLIRLTISPLPTDQGSESTGERLFVVIAHDVTSERQLENRMSQTEKLAGIGQLAAGIAHQLNTPLGSILLSAQMLADVDLPEDEAEDVDRIIRQTDQCRQIIKGLLNFARPQSRERGEVPLAEAVHETVYLMEKSLKVAGVEVNLVSEGDPIVLGNRNELDQVFFNLLVNAVDAMPDGGRIDIVLGPGDPGEILVSFADTGPGIAPEHRDRIFLPFYTTKDYGKGTGLGLSIVARIMHEHGGRIELDERNHSGARFLLAFSRPNRAAVSRTTDRS